jgi:hypothetical protein
MASDHDVTETAAWQLAHKLNLRVDLFLLSPDFRRHYRHSDRLSLVVRSAPEHIVAGSECDRAAYAGRVRLAKGSQAEVLKHLSHAYDQRLITLDELQIAARLTKRAMKAASGLIRALEATHESGAEPARRRMRSRIRPAPTGSG